LALPIYVFTSSSGSFLPAASKWNGASAWVPICRLVRISPMLNEPLCSFVPPRAKRKGVSPGQCAMSFVRGCVISIHLFFCIPLLPFSECRSQIPKFREEPVVKYLPQVTDTGRPSRPFLESDDALH